MNSGIGNNSITSEKIKDAGMALVLLVLIVGIIFKIEYFQMIALGVLVINMIVPVIYKPFAVVWFWLATRMGECMSKIILSLIFYLVVMPIGLFRRLLGKDSMQLKKWKNNKGSVFVERNHIYTVNDLAEPY